MPVALYSSRFDIASMYNNNVAVVLHGYDFDYESVRVMRDKVVLFSMKEAILADNPVNTNMISCQTIIRTIKYSKF